jgi:5S rRNA maturation endonuclease (ribonuclease M5)
MDYNKIFEEIFATAKKGDTVIIPDPDRPGKTISGIMVSDVLTLEPENKSSQSHSKTKDTNP